MIKNRLGSFLNTLTTTDFVFSELAVLMSVADIQLGDTDSVVHAPTRLGTGYLEGSVTPTLHFVLVIRAFDLSHSSTHAKQQKVVQFQQF